MGCFVCPRCGSSGDAVDGCKFCGYSGDIGNWRYRDDDNYTGPLEKTRSPEGDIQETTRSDAGGKN